MSNAARPGRRINFARVNAAALQDFPGIVHKWLPIGQRRGDEYSALNPTRPDRRQGSFKINLITGKWADFATGDRGGDPVSLCAYLFNLSQADAARRLADLLAIDPYA